MTFATPIRERNVSLAWLRAIEQLLAGSGDLVHLVVTMEHPAQEHAGIRRELDTFLDARLPGNRHGRSKVWTIATVANTVFPHAFYNPDLGEEAASHLFRMKERLRKRENRLKRQGSLRQDYFRRMVDWDGANGRINQVERVLKQLRANRQRNVNNQNRFEIAVYCPGRDSLIGFPCLSSISLSLHGGRLHMAALYRNHYFMRRAYGNYLGLGRLLEFLARESAYEPGELMCISTHATAEIGQGKGFARTDLTTLRDACQQAAGPDEERT